MNFFEHQAAARRASGRLVLLFGLALFAVSARIWLPGDMLAPAPIS